MMRPSRSDRDPLPALREATRVTPGSQRVAGFLALLATAVLGNRRLARRTVRLDHPGFRRGRPQFYEVPLLAAIRRPSQLVLVRWHLAIGSVSLVVGLFAAPMDQPARQGLSGDLRNRLRGSRDHLDLRRKLAAGARR